jgi:hypothetical protein
MRVHPLNLALLVAIGFGLPAWAEDREEVTDELPEWVEEELEDARAWQMQLEGGASYGADIPSPEAVMHGGAPASATAGPARVTPPREEVTFDDFREGLAPYGRWVHTPEYGLVFVPSPSVQVGGWRPYLYGQWVWTRYGWTWVSEEPFGWATYHYGRWGFRAGLGWFWVPGYVWGPAWVAWRHGPDVIGWAPLYPGYVQVTAGYPIVVEHWIFVGHRHFHGHPIHRHWHRHHHHHHFHHSHWAKHWRSSGRVYAGPPRRWVERHGGPVHETRIVHAVKPAPSRVVSVGGRRQVELYRPSAKGAVRPTTKPARPGEIRASRPTVGSGLLRGAPAMQDVRRGPTSRPGSEGVLVRQGPARGGVEAPKAQPSRRPTDARSVRAPSRDDRPSVSPRRENRPSSREDRPSVSPRREDRPSGREDRPSVSPKSPRSSLAPSAPSRPSLSPKTPSRPAVSLPAGKPPSVRSAAPSGSLPKVSPSPRAPSRGPSARSASPSRR